MGLPPAYGSEGAGFQLFIQSNGSSGVYADAAARDVYFGANPSELVRLDSNEFLIIKLLDDGAGSVAYQQRSGGNWVDVTSLIQGETGPGGATGNSYFFSSIAARDTFFSTSPNEGLLENGLPVIVNIGDDTQSTFVWGGDTAPPSYDSELWRLSASEISSGTLFLGIGGASISSGSEVLNFITTDGSTTYIHGIKYDDTGSENPTYWKLGALAQFPLADVFDTILTDPQILSTTNTLNAYVKDYTLIPATSGELRVQTWLGTDETGPSIVDTFITVAPGDIGNETVFTAPNNTLILTGQDTYTKLSGITLYGGLQTLPTFVGQVVPFVTLGLWAATSYEFITADSIGSDTEILYNNAGAIDGTSNITYSGTSLDFADSTSIKMGTDDDLSIDHNGINTIISNSTGEIFVDNTSPSGSIIFRLLGVFPGNTRFDIRDSTSADIFSVLGSGAVQLQDNVPLRFGAGNDFTIIHNETDTLLVSNTGDIEFYNTDATGLIYFTLGTDTALTSFQVRNNSSVPLFEVFGNGFVGIGTSTPHAPLQFANTVVNRKIVLFETGNNDHQFYGFGVDNLALRYQVDNITADHVFYAATSSTTSDELFRITGDGLVGIGTNSPNEPLQITADVEAILHVHRDSNVEDGSTAAGILFGVRTAASVEQKAAILFRRRTGWGRGDLVFALNNIEDNSNASLSDALMTLSLAGNLGIGVTDPQARLHVSGDAIFDGVVYPENVVGYIKNGETGFAERHISTGVFSATTIPLTATGVIYGAWWGKEGTRLYVTTADAYIYQYNLTVPYDITTATFTASNNFTDPSNSNGYTLWNDDGTVFYHGGRGSRTITLTSAWEISGIASDAGNFDLSFQDPINMYDLRWNFDGTKVLGVGDSINQAQPQSFIEWECTTPYDLTTTTQQDANIYPFPTGVPDTVNIVKGFDISPDGKRVYLSAPSTGIEYEVVLETAWDLSSGTLVDTITRTSHTDIVNYSMAPDASGMVSVTPAGLIVQKKYGLEFDGNLIVNDGNVGIGTSTPNAPLEFAKVTAFKKIVLYGEDNDNEFYGFGVQGGRFIYQVDSVSADHVFFAATSSASSQELFKIEGSGNSVAIGAVGTGGRFTFTKSADDSAVNIFSGSATGSASTIFYNSTPAQVAGIEYDETNNNFSISTEAAVDLILTTGAGANIGVNKPLPVSTLHISEGTTTSDSTTGTTFEQIGLGSAVTHYVRTLTGTVFSSGIDEDDVYKISNDYALGVNTDIAINTEANIDFKNTIATPYGGFGRLQNLLLWSEDTTNAAWLDFPAILTVTGDTTLAPDGTLSADTWDFTATIGIARRPLVTLAQGNTYTVSFYARALTTARILRFDLGDALSGDINVLPTDDLQRYSLQLVAGSSNWLDVTNVVESIGTVYVWGFQINEGVELLPYTRTEAVQVHGTGPESGLAINHSAIFSTIAAPNYSEGTVFYDDGDKALSYYNEDSNVTVGIGRDLLVRVQNDQGTTISSGEAVYINGSSAGLPTVKLARSDSSVTSQFAGIVTETLVLNGEIGYVSTFGLIEFLNTSAWLAGDELYLSSTVAGALTKVAPTDPNHIVSVAHVVISDLITGSIQVHTPERIAPDALYSSIYSPITAPAPHTEGQVYYDTDDKSLSYQTSSTDVTINIGKEIVVPPQVYNGQGSAITNGQAVYVAGSTGVYPEVKLAQANSAGSAHSVGLITETSIANGATGYCTTYGLVRGFNTTSWSAGDVLYLSTTVAGGLQNTKPVFPNLAIRMGIVISSAVDGTIWVTYPVEEATTGGASTTRSFAFSDSGAADASYLAGFYEAPTSSTQLTIGGASTITYGTANVAYGAHAFCVASAAGGTDLVLTVSGTSITDAGVRTTSDSEILVADTDAAITDQYFETTKKWVGQIVYELTGAAGSFTFNYGFCKYEDFGNRDFTVVDFEFVGKSGVNAANMNIELLLHSDAGWTYDNINFVPGGTTIVSLATDYSIDDEIAADEYFAYKRGSLSQAVSGVGTEGVIIRFTQATNNSVDYGTAHIGVLI